MNPPRRFLVVKEKDGTRSGHGTAVLFTEGNPLWITSHPLDEAFGVRYLISENGQYSPALPIDVIVEDKFPIQGIPAQDSISPYIYRLALGKREESGGI